MTVMGNDSQTNDGREIKKRWSLICDPRVWMVLLAIAVTHVEASKGKTISSEMRMTRRSNITIGERVCNAPECYQVAKFVNDSINYTVDPCDDFYHYACGGWIENHPIPIGDSLYHVRSEMEDKIEFTKRRILEAGISDINGVSRDVVKIPYDVYHSCMNTTAVENLGDASLKKLIQEFGNWTMVEENGDWNESNWDFTQVLASIHRGYYSKRGPLFAVRVIPNPHNKSRFAIEIEQEGLRLHKQRYLESEAMDWLRGQYIKFPTLLGGRINISEKAQDIIDFETKLANISKSRADSRTREMTIKELQDEAPNLQWLNHLNSVFAPERLNENETIYVRQNSLSYLKNFMAIVLQTPKSVLANYMVTTLLWDERDFLPKRYGPEDFRNRTTRLKSCLKYATVKLAGDIFGALYIYDNLPKYVKMKEKVKVMAAEVHESFKENVKALSWMDDITKNRVIEKNEFMVDSLIFPDYYLNVTQLAKKLDKYDGIVTRSDTYHSNAIALKKAKHRSYLKNLRRTSDRAGDDIIPASFEAYYYPSDNKIIIPAGLVQPPVYRESDNDYLRSITMGSLGFYLGHEIVHGFGRRGSVYDKYGRKTSNWWTQTSMTPLMGKIRCIMNQYSQYKIFETIPINFKNTIDEDIADNGGLKAALKAYYNWSRKNVNETWRLPGLNFTNEQLFFLGFGQNMCANIKREKRLEILRDEVHSDLQYRINGVLSNSLDFANAFNCRKNSPMNPSHKCALWSKEGSLT